VQRWRRRALAVPLLLLTFPPVEIPLDRRHRFVLLAIRAVPRSA
jgi:hypothetical protein